MMKNSKYFVRHDSLNEAVYLKAHTQVVARSRLVGAIEKEQLIWAVQCLEKKYPILRLIPNADNLIERSADCAELIEWIECDSVNNVYNKLLNVSIDFGTSLYKVYVLINDKNIIDLFTVTSHTITDGISLVTLHRDLIYFCDTCLSNHPPQIKTQPIAQSIDDIVNKSIQVLSIHSEENRSNYLGEFLQLPYTNTFVEKPEYCLETITIKNVHCAKLSQSCKQQHISFHGLLTACFAKAIQTLSAQKTEKILMRSSIDLRRRVTPHLSNEIICAAITGHITCIPNMNADIIKIAKEVMEEINSSTKKGIMFDDYLQYPKRFVSEHTPIALNISNMSNICLTMTEHFKQLSFDYLTPWRKTCPNVSVAINSGKLTANLVYIKQYIHYAVIDQLSQLVQSYFSHL